ncbi:hypothetical protein FA13DRAFT_1744739 [Coprinellus micaceus]|uniref:Uncharacterized protein n=1 Tax=Coprinellus micaceus TaxID=71717 RepID=A0A4Y7SBT6_COPMI|nr:hypothetical protein FA13DRAFT_1744739 [Coprinellus micaceus]
MATPARLHQHPPHKTPHPPPPLIPLRVQHPIQNIKNRTEATKPPLHPSPSRPPSPPHLPSPPRHPASSRRPCLACTSSR